MLYLKAANLEDWEKEYEAIIHQIPTIFCGRIKRLLDYSKSDII